LLVVSADFKAAACQKTLPRSRLKRPKKNPGIVYGDRSMCTQSESPHVRTAEKSLRCFFDESEQDKKDKEKKVTASTANKNTTLIFPRQANDDESPPINDFMCMAYHGQSARRSLPGLIALRTSREFLWQTIMLHLSFGARTIPNWISLHLLMLASVEAFLERRRRRKAC